MVERIRESRVLEVGIEDLLESSSAPGQMALNGPFADMEKLCYCFGFEIVPIGEHDDGSLPKTEPVDGSEDLGPNLGLGDDLGSRRSHFPRPSSAIPSMKPTGLVEHTAIEVRPWLSDTRPLR
jgi:hypothetical protein